MNANLYDLLRSRFPADPAVPLLITGDGVLTYGAIEGQSGRMAAVLRGLGVDAGDRVTAQVDKSPAALMLYLACLRVGAVFQPLNPAYTDTEVGFFLSDAEPKVLVCAPERRDGLAHAAGEAGVAAVLDLDSAGGGSLASRAAGEHPDPRIAEVGADDLAALIYTSGTTGRSKGAMLSHANLASNALTLHRLWGFVPGDVLLHALPIYHVHGLFVAVHCAMLNGSPMVWMNRFDAAKAVAALGDATVMMGVPTFYTRMLDQPGLDRAACAGMRLFISGSAPLLPETFARFERRTGHRILERYGMSEAGMICSNPLDGARVPGTVGFALPDVAVRICDEDGRAVAPGETGVLEMHGPNLFKGYWRMPEQTAAEMRDDGFFISGDMAVMDDEGRVSIVGRAKDLIISGGFNVYPKEVEAEIDAIDGVAESAVIGAPHPDFGEAVVAVVVREAGSDITAEDVTAALHSRLARFKQPKRIAFVDALPRNTMGKVQKADLRASYRDSFSA